MMLSLNQLVYHPFIPIFILFHCQTDIYCYRVSYNASPSNEQKNEILKFNLDVVVVFDVIMLYVKKERFLCFPFVESLFFSYLNNFYISFFWFSF